MEENIIKLTIASLLHDIGKVVQRADEKKGTHSKIGADYLEKTLKITDKDILHAVRYHHEKEMLQDIDISDFAYLTCTADKIASTTECNTVITEQIEDDSSLFDSKRPLQTTFTLLHNHSSPLFYQPTTKNTNFPSKRVDFDASIYKKILEDMTENLKSFEITQSYINLLLEITEKKLSFVPSSTNKEAISDISLYDHMKLTAAIASCLYMYLGKNIDYKQVLFTKDKLFNDEFMAIHYINISGIKDFIYNIHSSSALKTLRARSFYLELLSENLIDDLLNAVGLSRANLLYSVGGKIYLILPNSEEVANQVNDMVKKANQKLLSKFNTQLYIANAYISCSPLTLKNDPAGSYDDILLKLNQSISAKKLNKYTVDDIKYLNSNHKNGIECQICRSLKDTETNHCPICTAFLALPIDNEHNFFVVTDQNQTNAIPMLGKYVIATTEDKLRSMLNEGQVIRFYGKNKWLQDEKISTKMLVSDYTYDENIDIYTKESNSINKLGVLRMNVDNLIDTFKTGFEAKYNTISRTSILSRSLSLFFKNYINKCIEGKKANVIYSVGDDLFIIGKWNHVFDIAKDIYRDFERYTQGKLSLSAGFGIYPEKYPIHIIANQTEMLQDIAKKEGKDRITLFQNRLCFTWQELDNVLEKIKMIEGLKIGNSFLNKMLSLIDDDQNKVINLSRLAYLLSKDNNIPQELTRKIYEFVQEKQTKKELTAAIYLHIYSQREEANRV